MYQRISAKFLDPSFSDSQEAWSEMSSLGVKPTARSWRLRLGALARSRDAEGALHALREMRDAGFPQTPATQSAAFAAVGASGALPLLHTLFQEQLSAGCMGTAEAFAAAYGAVAAWGRATADARAEELASDLKEEPEGAATSGHLYQRSLASALLRQMEEAQAAAGVRHTAASLLALVSALGFAGLGQRVRGAVRASKLPLTAPLLRAAVSACCRAGHVGDATALLHEARRQGVEPDAPVFTSLIAGCSFGGQSELAWQLLEQLRARGMAPGTHAYNALLKVECFAKGPDAGLRVLRAMHAASVVPDVVTWTTLLAAAKRAGRPDLVDEVLPELERLRAPAGDGDAPEGDDAGAAPEHWRGYYAQDDEDEW